MVSIAAMKHEMPSASGWLWPSDRRQRLTENSTSAFTRCRRNYSIVIIQLTFRKETAFKLLFAIDARF